MKQKFKHQALNLIKKKPIVFTALSKNFFYMRLFVVKYVLDHDCVPINPFTSFDYFLLDTVKRDLIRSANNNLVAISDELWVFGSISDGVLAEIKQAKMANKTIKYFRFENDKDIFEILDKTYSFEVGLEKYIDELA